MRTLRQQPDPEAPTREEIREACEAVPGWTWCGDDGAYDPASEDHYFRLRMEHLWAADALALLGATGETWSLGWSAATGLYVASVGYFQAAAKSAPAAAARAVLQWARSKR